MTTEVHTGTLLARRFELHAHLGAGAFGAVYAAIDTASGRRVALKRLTNISGATIYRFKQEFRALAEVDHPNLVRLEELFFEGDEWFFSMELVDGVPFDAWVRRQRDGDDGVDLERLRPALAQLVAAIERLHAGGVLHRDLKPANVLVTAEGRVVVLDFGLATQADPDAQKSVLGLPMGTPAYMAPELALGRVTTAAADWYSLGVMMFEALYGEPPFSGTPDEVLKAKLAAEGTPGPAATAGGADLDELCRALLCPDPEDRPSADVIASALGAKAFASRSDDEEPHSGFVGRARELAALKSALDAVSPAGAVVVRVRGGSGVGKTALVRHFLTTLGPAAVVLQGRCFERESVPYKTLDGVVDALTRYLSGLSVVEASLLVPRQGPALCRLFPVFGRLRLIADQPERQRSSSPNEDRRRGFAALREVLARVGDRRPLVVTIDDLQWGDRDSIAPLAGLLAGPDAPRLLLLLTYRSSDDERLPVLRAISEPAFEEAVGDVRDLVLGPLEEADAVALAESLLPESDRARAPALARESGGLPLFLPELVRAQGRASGEGTVVSLEEALRERVARLSLEARRLLEVVAVAGRPTARRVLCSAAGIDEVTRDAAVKELAREHFVKDTSSDEGTLETFHDRVRESVVHGLSDEQRRAQHSAIASALEESGAADPEAIAEHYRMAGELARARPAAIAAAERATDAFAFERAIALYGAAREGAAPEARRHLTAKLADVLAYAGRGREAAAAYIEAVAGASPAEARELKRRAAEHLLRCGAVGEGLALSRVLVVELGLPFPQRKGVLLASVVSQRVLLGLRGYSFNERTPSADDERKIARVDLCWTIGMCLSAIDVVRGAEYQTRHLRYALALGDPYRVARGMGLEAILLSHEGSRRKRAQGAKLARRAWEIASRIDHPHALGFTAAGLAVVEWCACRWRPAVVQAEKALELYRTRSPESIWEVAALEVWYLYRALFFLGDLPEFVATVRRATRAAEERNDNLMATASKSAGMVYVHLLEDDPGLARTMSSESMPDWLEGEWVAQHQAHVRAQMFCDLYEGAGAQALARARECFPRLKRSMLLHTEGERIENFYLFSQAALLAGEVSEAERFLAPLEREKSPLAKAFYQAGLSGLLAARSDAGAASAYEQAALMFERLEMVVYAAIARSRRGALLAGSEGEALVSASDALLASKGVVDPIAWARIHMM